MKTLTIIISLDLLLLGALTWASSNITYRSTLDFPLYKNEKYWGGNQQSELKSFIEGGRKVLVAQTRIARSIDGKPRRVFHAKQHGCLTGKLVLLKNRPTDTQGLTYQGVFNTYQRDSYNVIVRFSNGIGIMQPDRVRDVRGVAIKIFGVENKETGQTQTVDFLMTNSPTPFGRDFLEFVSFMEDIANHGNTWGPVLFSARHYSAGKALLGATGIFDYKVKSVATIRYWGGHPYLLGPNTAMKFNIIPSEYKTLSTDTLSQWGDQYLRKDLRMRTMRHPVKFTFAIQLEKNEVTTPIENNLKEWEEKDSPSIPVAELILDQQDFWKDEIDQSCDDLQFTPGHYIPDHRPLSNMGRGRLFGYEASQTGRGSGPPEPNESLFSRWQELNRVD